MTVTSTRLHLPAGTAARPPARTWSSRPSPPAGRYSGLRGAQPGAPGSPPPGRHRRRETLVLPLEGVVHASPSTVRPSSPGPAATSSAGPATSSTCPATPRSPSPARGGGRFALPSARCERRLPFRYQPADAVPVELRGAGRASRQVNNFCTPDAFEADALIACEVLTPGGNWSSYPPHKHDEASRATRASSRRSTTSRSPTGPAGPGIGYQRVYGHPGKEIDVLAEVRSGDVVLIPYGWHGPSMAVPGYDLYYLNVMAGPGDERAWRICDDPAHAWVRETWATRRSTRGCRSATGPRTPGRTDDDPADRRPGARALPRGPVRRARRRRERRSSPAAGASSATATSPASARPCSSASARPTTALPRPRAALPPGPQRAGDGARGGRLRPPARPAGDLRVHRVGRARARPTW